MLPYNFFHIFSLILKSTKIAASQLYSYELILTAKWMNWNRRSGIHGSNSIVAAIHLAVVAHCPTGQYHPNEPNDFCVARYRVMLTSSVSLVNPMMT